MLSKAIITIEANEDDVVTINVDFEPGLEEKNSKEHLAGQYVASMLDVLDVVSVESTEINGEEVDINGKDV